MDSTGRLSASQATPVFPATTAMTPAFIVGTGPSQSRAAQAVHVASLSLLSNDTTGKAANASHADALAVAPAGCTDANGAIHQLNPDGTPKSCVAGGGSAAPAGIVSAFEYNAGGATPAPGGDTLYRTTGPQNGIGAILSPDGSGHPQYGGANPSAFQVEGNNYAQWYSYVRSAPADQKISRWITLPDGTFNGQLMRDDNGDGDVFFSVQRNASNVVTESLAGNLRLGGGPEGDTNCDVFSNNPSSVHARIGIGTCAPATVYGVAQPNASAFQVYDANQGDAYVAAHTNGSGRPHFHLWGEQLGPAAGSTGAYDMSVSSVGDFIVDSVAGPSTHHTSIQCFNFYASSDVALRCSFPFGYAGPFDQTASNPYNGNANSWAGSILTSNWSVSPDQALARGIGTPNYAALNLNIYGQGGYNDYNPGGTVSNFFKTNWAVVLTNATFQGMGQHQIWPSTTDCWGVGDCIAGEETLNHIGGGQDSASEGVHGRRVNVIESPNTSVGSCSTGCTAGSTLFGLSGQFLNQLGEGHYIADLTAEVISPAYLTPSQGQDANTGLQINAISGDTFPVSQMFRLGVDVPSPSHSAAPGIVTVPIQTSGVPSGYLTTTSGIPASGLTCVWDLTGAGRKMQPYSVVDASHISINLSVALHAGSMIALNGMCGYGIDSIADQVLPQGGNMKIHRLPPPSPPSPPPKSSCTRPPTLVARAATLSSTPPRTLFTLRRRGQLRPARLPPRPVQRPYRPDGGERY